MFETIIKTNTYPTFFSPKRLLLVKKEAPASEQIRAWLSLDGRPKSQAKIPKITTQSKVAQAILELFAPLSEKTNLAIFEPNKYAKSTPKKLQIAQSQSAFFNLIAPVQTAVATTLGASVKPLTKTTPTQRKIASTSKNISTTNLKS